MPGSADFIQRAVHALEAGGLAIWIRRGLVVVIVLAGAIYYFSHFRGLATSQAMDQAQIARSIASGHGWQTKFIRPRAIGQLKEHGRNVQRNIWFDTYNAPLPPLVNALPLLLVKSHWKLAPTDLISAGDQAIAATSILLFGLSVFVLFFTARRLFDQRLAGLVCALVLLCDTIWQYSLSGLPQMLLLFLFNCTLYVLIRAVQAKYAGEPVLLWLGLAGLGFGLLALSHALTIWIFLGALVFCVYLFPPRLRTLGIVLGVFLIVYTPWLVRTYAVCGNPCGMALYSVLDGIRFSESAWMRSLDADLQGIRPADFRGRFSGNLISEFDRIFDYLGWSVVALAFFVALLHAFKRPDTAAFRWLVLAMWLGAVFGMALFGIREEQGYAANQLHLIFIPIMTCYGLAFLLVQWSRLDVKIGLARLGFIALLFLLCAFPTLNTMLLSRRTALIQWPPYVPPYIAVMNDWLKPNEVVASDMPWAIAWYADRPGLWLPDTINNFTEMSDYRVLGGPINGLYLTSISGASNTLRDVVKGEYKDWAPLIQRTMNLEKFRLRYPTLLGVDNEAVFFGDRDRSPKPK